MPPHIMKDFKHCLTNNYDNVFSLSVMCFIYKPSNFPYSELKKAWWYRIFTNKCTTGDIRKRKYIPSVSSALIVGAVLGLLQAITLAYSAKLVLNVMGVKSVSNNILT